MSVNTRFLAFFALFSQGKSVKSNEKIAWGI